jgi:hypothetical protein
MRKIILGALIAATCGVGVATVAPVAPAQAQNVIIGPDGVRVQRDRYEDRRDYRRDHRRGIGQREASRIAERNGIRRIRSITDNGPNYVVRGEARGPGDLRITISKRTGNVIRTERIIRR